MEIRNMGYKELFEALSTEGHPFLRLDETLDEIGDRHGLTNEHGEFIRPFSAVQVAEVVRRLGPPPRPAGRPAIGPEVKTRLTTDEIAALDQRAATEGIDRSELLRRIIRRNLAETTGANS